MVKAIKKVWKVVKTNLLLLIFGLVLLFGFWGVLINEGIIAWW